MIFRSSWAGPGARVKARSDEAFRKLIARFIGFYTDNLLSPDLG